jgi:hypothetical protein
MHPDDQHLLVIRAVENADPAALGQRLHAAPKKIVVQLFRRRMLERINLAALRIDPRHDVLDRAVFSRRVHRLKDDEQRPGVVGIELLLGLAQRRNILRQHLRGQFLSFRFRDLVIAIPCRVIVLQPDFLPGRNAEHFNDRFAVKHGDWITQAF